MKSSKQTAPRLELLPQFEVALSGYEPSKATITILQKLPLVILVGPTAAGRNTLINILVNTGRYHMIVSDTTRPPRLEKGEYEKNGKVYWFKSEQAVLEGIRNGEYIEANIIHGQQVSGANISEVKRAHQSGAIALKEIEIGGANKYQSYKPDILSIFLLPPTFDIWMERIRSRSDVDELELRRRLESAQSEISQALASTSYQFVINYEIHEAAQAVDEMANGRQINPEKQQAGRDHAERLLIDIKLYLES